MNSSVKEEILKPNVSEQIQLVGDIWDCIAESSEVLHLTKEQKRELANRLDAYHQKPDEGAPW